MKTVLLLIFILGSLFFGFIIWNLYTKQLYFFSEVRGQVLKGGLPLTGIKVSREYKSDLFGNKTEATRTDADGNFHFREETGKSFWWFVAPLMNGGLNQLIKIKHQGTTYTAWQYRHHRFTQPNGELEGKPIHMVCDLDQPERANRLNGYESVWGLGNLGLEYDIAYTKAKEQINSHLDQLKVASDNILSSKEFKKQLIKQINKDSILLVTDIQIEQTKGLELHDFSLTKQEGVVLFHQNFHLIVDLTLHTSKNGTLAYTSYASVNYLLYNIYQHQLLDSGTLTDYDGIPFLIGFEDLYAKVLKSQVKTDELQDGLEKILKDPKEIKYLYGLEAIRATKELLRLKIDTLQLNGNVEDRDIGKFVSVVVSGKALTTTSKQEKWVDFSYPASIELNSLRNPPYTYLSNDYVSLWVKGSNGYEKSKQNQE